MKLMLFLITICPHKGYHRKITLFLGNKSFIGVSGLSFPTALFSADNVKRRDGQCWFMGMVNLFALSIHHQQKYFRTRLLSIRLDTLHIADRQCGAY